MAKTIWPEKIEAPEEALELYRLISKLQDSEAFRHCHVFSGANIKGLPHVRWEGRVTNLPKVILSFLALPYKRKMCVTPGCVNPFHYVDLDLASNEIVTAGVVPQEENFKAPDIDQYVETVRYYIEENDLESPSYEQLRKLIPVEDVPDELLQQSLKKILP